MQHFRMSKRLNNMKFYTNLKMTRILTFLFLLSFISLQAQNGYKIEATITDFEEKELYLGYHYGEKQYVQDTVQINADGKFVFEGDEPLGCGIYLIIMPPNNKYFQLLIKDENNISLTTSAESPVKDMKVTGSKENELFYEYLGFLSEKRPEAEQLSKGMKAAKEAGEDEKTIEELKTKLEKVNKDVKAYQRNLIDKNKGMLVSSIINANLELSIPEDITENRAKYLWVKKHWFDNLDLTDACMLKTPVVHSKIEYYMEKLTPRHPDSLAESIDYILAKAEPTEEVYKFAMIHFLNKYAKSKVVGYDAVYVHIAEKYYATGKAHWTDKEQLAKIVENGQKLKPLLIGKIAPEIKVPELDIEGTIAAKDAESEYKRFKVKDPISLHETNSPYKVLFIWSPDCGHCKKSMPKVIEFYDNYKDKGVKLYAVCHRNYKETLSCAEFIKERPEMMEWINVTDPFFKSKYHDLYDVKSTPQVYILDENNEILSKKIGAEQLGEVIDQLIEIKEKEAMEGK